MVASIAELEACLGPAGLPAKLKEIDHLDPLAADWIAKAALGSLVVASKSGAVRATLVGGEPGFATADGAHVLTLPVSAIDRSDGVQAGDGVALLFFAPGVTETLRVNGRVSGASSSVLSLRVDECFVHCGKALIRSSFWKPTASQATALPCAARFCVFGTADAAGSADASPKGDPEGFLSLSDETTLVVPDRTGNRRADGHRNIIAHDRVALVAFAPGSTRVIELEGRARLVNDEAMLETMSVDGKAPKIATVVKLDRSQIYESNALRRARVWDGDRMSAERPNVPATFAAHIKLSQKRLAAPAFDINAGMVEVALESDYKTNLY